MKSYKKFVQEAKGDGASPYEVYKAPAQPTKPSPPPADFRDKYLPKSPVKQAQMVPPKANTPIDTRTPAQKLLQLQQLRKQNPTV